MQDRKMAWLMLLLALSKLISRTSSDAIADMLSPFIDLEEIAAQAAEESPQNGVATPADDAFRGVWAMNPWMQPSVTASVVRAAY
jgi:hypothetical protein